MRNPTAPLFLRMVSLAMEGAFVNGIVLMVVAAVVLIVVLVAKCKKGDEE